MGETNKPVDLEAIIILTPEMIEAGAEIVLQYNPAHMTPQTQAEAVYRTMQLKRPRPFDLE